MPDDVRPLTREDLKDALKPLQDGLADQKTAMNFMALDVKSLALDHVTHAQFEALRNEMREGFRLADDKYTSRDFSDLRYQELSKRLDSHDDAMKDIRDQFEAAEHTEKEHGFQFGNNLVTWLLTLIITFTSVGGLIISILTLMHGR